MKIKSIIAASLAVLTLLLSSCGTQKNAINTSSPDYMNGNVAGVVLKSLVESYKATGSLDLSNVENVLNLSSFISTLSSLKSGSTQAFNDYGFGLIAGSKNIVNENNVKGIVDSLTELSDLDLGRVSSLIQRGKTTAPEVSDAKVSFENIFANLLK